MPEDNGYFLSEFEVYRENIPERDGWITETIMRLAPSSYYDIRLRATNQRPEMPDYSDYVYAEAKTKGAYKYKLMLCKVLRIYLM